MKLKLIMFITVLIAVMSVFTFAQKEDSKSESSIKEQCGDKVGDFVLCIETDKSEFKVDEPVLLRLFLKNISDQKVELMTSSVDYSYEVKNKDGESVDFLKDSDSYMSRFFISARKTSEIEPSGKLFKPFVLSKLYDLGTAGEYSIVAKRLVPKNSGGKSDLEIKSKEIKIKITPK